MDSAEAPVAGRMSFRLPSDNPYSVSRLKTFRGMEGPGFNATLTRDGKRVCEAIDQGDGGEVWYEFVSKAEEDAYSAFVERLRSTIPPGAKFYDTPERDLFSRDILTEEIVIAFEVRRKMRRDCRTCVVFQVGDQIGSGDYFKFKVPYSPRAAEEIRRRHPGKAVRIVNEEADAR